MCRRNSKRQQARKAKDRGLRFRRNTDDGNTDAKEIESSGAKDHTPRTIMTENGFKAGVGNPAYN